jgi:hypothetical protein
MGLVAFWILVRRMKSASIPSPPLIPYFVLFATVGGLLLILLTSYFWYWSGMASLGIIYLVLVAPFLTAFLAWTLRHQRVLSLFHQCAFIANIAYTCLTLAFVVWATSTGLIGR